MARTYLPGLVAVAQNAHRFATRWTEQILGNDLSNEQVTAFVNWVACTATLIAAFTKAPPTE